MYRPFVKNFISLGILTGASSSATNGNVNTRNDALEIENVQATVALSSSSSEESIEEQISESISSCSAPAPSMLKKAVATAQLNKNDIHIAMNNIFARPDLLERFVPPHVNRREMYRAVESLLTDQLLLEDVCSNLHTARTGVSDSEVCTDEWEQIQDEDTDEPIFQTGNMGRDMHRANIWDSLCLSHGCSICHDVLACPVVTNCSHTFCGACLDAQMTKVCENDASSPSVAHHCPTCKKEIGSPIFERMLHRDICGKIASTGLCADDNPAMAEWKKRCEVYEQKTQQERVHEISARNDHDSDDDNSERSNDDSKSYETGGMGGAGAFFLALTVIFMLMLARARMHT